MKIRKSSYSINKLNQGKKHRFLAGFTLFELIMSIAIMGVVTVWIGMLLLQIVENFNIIENRQNIAMQGKITMDWMVNDIREISVSGSDLSLSNADLNKVSFTSVSGEPISYEFISGLILRSNKTLCENVSNLVFTYWDVDNIAIPSPVSLINIDRIHHVVVNLSLSRAGEAYNLESWITLRNVRM